MSLCHTWLGHTWVQEPPYRFWCMDCSFFTAWSANLIHCLHPRALMDNGGHCIAELFARCGGSCHTWLGCYTCVREPPCRFWCMDAPFTAWSANLICHCLHPHAVRNVWSPALWVCECRSRRHCYLMHFVGIASGFKCVAAVYSDCGYIMIQYSDFGDTHSPIHAYLSIPLRLRFWSVMWAEIQ